MPLLEHYRESYEHEKDCDRKMLAMLASVPPAGRADARFPQALSITGHLADCREFWIAHMNGEVLPSEAEPDGPCDLPALGPRFDAIHARWTDYLARLDPDRLARDFAFSDNGQFFRQPTEVQIVQLFGHASYHRGQIALLVDQLGGEVLDTDYVDWWWANRSG